MPDAELFKGASKAAYPHQIQAAEVPHVGKSRKSSHFASNGGCAIRPELAPPHKRAKRRAAKITQLRVSERDTRRKGCGTRTVMTDPLPLSTGGDSADSELELTLAVLSLHIRRELVVCSTNALQILSNRQSASAHCSITSPCVGERIASERIQPASTWRLPGFQARERPAEAPPEAENIGVPCDIPRNILFRFCC